MSEQSLTLPRGGVRESDPVFVPTPHLKVTQDGPVTVLTIDNPAMRNAFTEDLHAALQEVWAHLAAQEDVRAVVLTGSPEARAFSAGGDIPGFVRQIEDPAYRIGTLRGARMMMDAMAAFPKPVVAAVNGPAVGLGCSLALGCDVILIGASAWMADTHVSVGLVCGDGGAAVFPLLMSLVKAKEYLLTGDRIPAAEAVAIGLANRVVADDALMTEAMALAHRLAAQPAQAVQQTKRAINLHLQHAIAAVMPFALSAEYDSFDTPDVRRAVERFTSG